MSQLQNITIVGGTGNLGRHIVAALLQKDRFAVTALSRVESDAVFPTGVAVSRVDYSAKDALVHALQGCDALVITLSGTAPPDVQTRIIDAAVTAGVPWILPNEYGPDSANARMISALPILSDKKQYRDQIEASGSSHWIGVITGLWYDYGMKMGAWGINIQDRTASLYGEGHTKCSVSSVAQAGRMVAHLLSLPVHASSGACLAKYQNANVYARSFDVSQRDMLHAILGATGTTAHDWKISSRATEDAVASGQERVKQGERSGLIDVLFGLQFASDTHADFSAEAENAALGLELEDVQTVTQRVVQEMQEPAPDAHFAR